MGIRWDDFDEGIENLRRLRERELPVVIPILCVTTGYPAPRNEIALEDLAAYAASAKGVPVECPVGERVGEVVSAEVVGNKVVAILRFDETADPPANPEAVCEVIGHPHLRQILRVALKPEPPAVASTKIDTRHSGSVEWKAPDMVRAARAIVRALGMHAGNLVSQQQGEAVAHTEAAFQEILEQEGLAAPGEAGRG